jgi:hypothetical protein
LAARGDTVGVEGSMKKSFEDRIALTGKKTLKTADSVWCFKCGRTSARIVVRSRRGGFVTQNCVECGHPSAVRLAELPLADCGRCGNPMKAVRKWDGYVYECGKCKHATHIGGVVPDWSDLFQYDGYAIENDPSKNDPWP